MIRTKQLLVWIALGLTACATNYDDPAAAGGVELPAASTTAQTTRKPETTSDETAQAFRAQAAADLEADVTKRVAAARKQFGDKVPIRTLAGTFVLVGADPRAPFQAAVDEAQRALDVYLGSFFQRHPDRAVSVYIVGSEDRYIALCSHLFPLGCGAGDPGILGSYDRATRSIVANVGPGLPTLDHELVHPLIQTDFEFAPLALDEGIASLFEKAVFAPLGEMHGQNNWRQPRLLQGLASPTERLKTSPSALLGMDDVAFQEGPEDLHYALARSVCLWLDGRGQLWPFYRAWRDGVADDPDGTKAFTQVVGMTPQVADGVWREWVKTLR